jgi:hypothetical protein
MTLINLLVAPIQRVVNFPLFQLMTAIAVIPLEAGWVKKRSLTCPI